MHGYLKIIESMPWLPKVICGLLVFMTFIQLSFGVYDLVYFDKSNQSSQPHSRPRLTSSLSDKPPVMLPLFGSSFSSEMDASAEPQSPLNVEILGIICKTDADDCDLFVKMQDKEERTMHVHVGDELMPGVRIQKILRDEIYVSRQGRVERFGLPDKDLYFAPPPQPLGE